MSGCPADGSANDVTVCSDDDSLIPSLAMSARHTAYNRVMGANQKV